MSTVYFVLQQAIGCMVPLMIVAIGCMFSEKSGVMNIGLEGLMLVGAFTGIIFIHLVQAVSDAHWVLILALLVAGGFGMLFSLLHAYASINLNADQVISGTAINLLIPAAGIVIARAVFGVLQIGYNNTFRIAEVPVLSKIPFIGEILFKKTFITTYIGFGIVIVAAIVMNKTKFGMRLKACGEHPQAADSVGINVKKMRYMGVLLSGLLAGVGGLAFILPSATEYSGTVSGYGYLAMAVVIFGHWKSSRIVFASFFFGLVKTLGAVYTGIPFLLNSGINSYVFKMAPYVATLIVLAISSKKTRGPAALGQIYDKGAR